MCKNGGSCYFPSLSDLTNPSCFCKAEYTGNKCEKELNNACSTVKCLNGGTCIPKKFDGFACSCPYGYEGLLCEIDLIGCNPTTCLNGGSCLKNPHSGAVLCICPAGYTGGNCQIRVGPCASNPCFKGYCYDVKNGFVCACHSGFTGVLCDKIPNKCEPNPCLNGGTCAEAEFGYKCTCLSSI